MAEPQRRKERRAHLDAGVLPVKQALLSRASHLDEVARDANSVVAFLASILAGEFRALADELHYW